jgi:PAS domain-containing protein
VEVAVCPLDPEGVVLRANSEWLRSTGLTEAQAFGRRIWDLFPAVPPLIRRMHDESSSPPSTSPPGSGPSRRCWGARR